MVVVEALWSVYKGLWSVGKVLRWFLRCYFLLPMSVSNVLWPVAKVPWSFLMCYGWLLRFMVGC